MAYPFLSISIYLTVESSRRVAFGKWFLIGWLCESDLPGHYRTILMLFGREDQVILGILLGAVIGWLTQPVLIL